MSRSMPSLAALLAGCALLPVSSLAQLSFQGHQVALSSSGLPVSAHGDFNNDGREDIVSGTQLYLSNGDGTYSAPVALPASVDDIGDFNHDGKLDSPAHSPAWRFGSTSVKKYTETSSTSFDTTLSLSAGSHRFTVFAVNMAGTKWEQVINATVK